MKRVSSTASATLLLAACCLSACSAPKAAPELRVTSVSVAEAKTLADQFCADLARMSDEKAIEKMAVRASESKLSSADQDAIIDYAGASTCPDQF